MKDYNVTKLVPARKKAEFFRLAEKANEKKELVALARSVAAFYAEKHNLSKEDEKTLVLSLFASGLCVWEMCHASSIYEYMIKYIAWKQRISEKLDDFGAFGDGVETACHLINCRQSWRVNKTFLHVSAIGKTDLQIKGRRFEIGTNGKTWADSTEETPDNGPFDGVIYGVFDDEEKQAVIKFFRHGQIKEGLTLIARCLYVWEDKADFFQFMENVGRSSSIVWKNSLGKYQTVYNPSKHSAFIKTADAENVPTFAQYIKQFGENEFLSNK